MSFPIPALNHGHKHDMKLDQQLSDEEDRRLRAADVFEDADDGV